MLLALDGYTIVEIALFLQQLKKWHPAVFAFFAGHECLHVSNHDHAVSGPGDQDVESLGCRHEPNITFFVASGKGCDHNVAFFALVIICSSQRNRNDMMTERGGQAFANVWLDLPIVDNRIGVFFNLEAAWDSIPA
jgi:hypothetical protein